MVIFVSSIGRSGTRFLANLFGVCTDIPSFHALEPNCIGSDNITQLTLGKRTGDLEKKLATIRSFFEKNETYFESTQMFNRVLSDYIFHEFSDVRLIQLLRDPMEVAKSYTNRDSYPSHEGKPWRVPLNTAKSSFTFPTELTPFQENLCDWLDNELTHSTLKPHCSKNVVFHFSNFNNQKAILDLFSSLDVQCDRAKLKHHLQSEEKLDRNANKNPTELLPSDFREANQLIEILRRMNFPTTPFNGRNYSGFPFTKALLSASGKIRPTARQKLATIFTQRRRK